MQKENLPKILAITINAWRENSGINTLTNILSNWNPDMVAQIYTRTVNPNTSISNRFFRISEIDVLKSIFKRRTVTGKEVFNQPDDNEDKKESGLYSKKRGSRLYALAREFVWLIGKWKTAELDKFVDDFNADVVFAPIYPTVYMGRIQRYIIKKTRKPVVSYIADDNYTYAACEKSFISLLHRIWLRKYVRFIIRNSKKVFVIAPKQKEEYDRIFGIDSEILTKGTDFSNLSYKPKQVSNPIKMVYTGKLIIGRWKSLALMAEALGKINANGNKIELDIYTTDTLTEEQKVLLNRNGCSIKGALKLDEVLEVQKQADILVFVESLDIKYCRVARLSFSTKITDYLTNGKCILAVGNADIAPMDYFSRYDSAVTATSSEEIYSKLQMLVNKPDLILEYGKKAFDCGKAHHDINDMNKLFESAVKEICSK